MDRVLIPAVKYEEKLEKNIIVQQFDTGTTAEVFSEDPMLLKDEYNRVIYLTRRGNKIPDEYKYALYSDKRPVLDNVYAGNLKLKWARHPKLKHKPNKKRVIKSWEGSFELIEENKIEDKYGLRAPQTAALFSVLSHFRLSNEVGTVVMPTGTGKTETMLSLLVHEKCECLLISVPTDALREQIANKFSTFGLLKKFGIVDKKAEYPIVGIMKSKYKSEDELRHMLNTCNVVITTMSILTGYTLTFQKLIAESCSHYFIDEAHHSKARTWDGFLDIFSEKKVLQFTATPFRNDGKRLNGKIIFNYPLKKAQEDGYFTEIVFDPIFEYDPEKIEEVLAEKGVSILREDIKNGYNHLLMARCKNTKRAEKIYEIYKKYDDLNPVIIHSKMSETDKKSAKNKVINCESKIVVCVDMLGEGFDLPNLKVAVFHDIRQSLPITLQLAGRFTRTKFDEELRHATFVANLAEMQVKEELEDLYSYDSDWNKLLSTLSSEKIDDEVTFAEFMADFGDLNGEIPIQNIRPALSTVVYKSKKKRWNYQNLDRVLNVKKDDVFYSSVNEKNRVIVIIRGKKTDVEWGKLKEIQNVIWDLMVIYHNKDLGLLYINSTDKSSLYASLADAILGDDVKIINKLDIFRAFYDIKRTRLQNVGLKEFMGRNIRFRMSVGSDVEEALSIEEKKKGQKAFIYGTGYENGEKVSLGCSFKGRIWTRLVGDIKVLTRWCDNIGNKLIDETIDGNQLLKETLIPKYITNVPKSIPIYLDWDENLVLNSENIVRFSHGYVNKYLHEINLSIVYNTENRLLFSIEISDDIVIPFEIILFLDGDISSYKVEMIERKYLGATITIKDKSYSLLEYLNEYPPIIWFADGSSLCGNEYVELKQVITPYSREDIIVWDWSGVDISKEAQGVKPKIKDSIQYHVINELKKFDYDVIYDDDGRGEIADIVTIKLVNDCLEIELYHLKYSKGGNVNRQIANLYEVCGQAQKCVNWKHKEAKEFFQHLLRRKTKSKTSQQCSRIEKGTEKMLVSYSQLAKKRYPVKFVEYIVQPGVSKSRASNEQLTLLGVTDNFLKEYGGIDLHIIASK